MANILELNILQSLPVNCLNRDDTNSVKTVDIGGVTRTRVSSQCWKRAMREQLREDGVDIGCRSRLFAQRFTNALKARHPDGDEAAFFSASVALLKGLGADDQLKTLMFFSSAEVEEAADLIEMAECDPKKIAKLAPDFQARVTKTRGGHDGLDIAAFGRMMASRHDFDVEAAVSVAHAYTTHRTLTNIDYFTAVDDLNTDIATGHIGTNEFSSGVFYRYIVIDLDLLAKNLGAESIEEVRDGVGALIRAIFFAVPKARQHTMTAYRTWDYAHIIRRTGQPQQCLFEKPVMARGSTGLLAPSVEAMEADIARTRRLFGSSYGFKYETVFGQDDRSIDDLIGEIKAIL